MRFPSRYPSAAATPAVALLAAWQAGSDPFGPFPYLPDILRFTASLLFVVAPFVGALTALRVARLVDAGLVGLASRRLLGLQIARAGIGPVVMGCVGLVVGTVARVEFWPSAVSLSQGIGVIGVIGVLLGAAGLGAFIGLGLRSMVVAPAAAAIAVYLGLAFPPSFEAAWPRHLTGGVEGCCDLSDSVNLRAPLAALTAGVGFFIAAVIASLGWRRRTGVFAIGGAAAAVTGIVAAAVVAAPVGYLAVEPRDQAQIECEAINGLTVCLWPEQELVRDTIRGRADDLTVLLEPLVELPNRVSSAAGSEWFVSDVPRPTERDVFETLVSVALPPPEAVVFGCDGDSVDNIDTTDPDPAIFRPALAIAAAAWLWRYASDGRYEFADVNPVTAAYVAQIELLPVVDQQDWFVAARAAFTSCLSPLP